MTFLQKLIPLKFRKWAYQLGQCPWCFGKMNQKIAAEWEWCLDCLFEPGVHDYPHESFWWF